MDRIPNHSSGPQLPKYNLVFYSNHCEASKHLLFSMRTEKMIQYFEMICVDNNPNIPKSINRIPAIVVKGNPKIHMAEEAFMWLARIKHAANNARLRMMHGEQAKYLSTINENLAVDKCNILAYTAEEMSSTTDPYAFYSEDPRRECQDALPQSYFPCENMGKDMILTVPLEDGSFVVSKGCKLSSADTKTGTARLMAARDAEYRNLGRHLEQFHKSTS
jgi:hypothetical protein